MNQIFNQDCRTTLLNPRVAYDYVFCVPPDYDELEMEPFKDDIKYYDFLRKIFSLFIPLKNVVTIAITDRKCHSQIVDKHNVIINIMKSLGYRYISQKIWQKSKKQNLYRLNYSFVMSFANAHCKQNYPTAYQYDIWEAEVYKHKGYDYAIALEVVKNCIENFTDIGDVVYDCFAGSGTTAIACLDLGRKYMGSEISREFWELSNDRIAEWRKNKK